MIQPIGASERERNGPGSVEGRGLRPGPGVEAMMNSFDAPRERPAPRRRRDCHACRRGLASSRAASGAGRRHHERRDAASAAGTTRKIDRARASKTCHGWAPRNSRPRAHLARTPCSACAPGTVDGVQGLLRNAGRRQDRDRRRHQEGVPPARAEVPPGRQQGAGCGRTHVGDQRGEHRPVRSGEARRLRRARTSAAGPGLPSAARLGRGLRVLRRRVRAGRGRVQRLLRQSVRPRGARAPRRRCRVDARRRPSRQGRDRPGRRVSRGHAGGDAALGAPRRTAATSSPRSARST